MNILTPGDENEQYGSNAKFMATNAKTNWRAWSRTNSIAFTSKELRQNIKMKLQKLL